MYGKFNNHFSKRFKVFAGTFETAPNFKKKPETKKQGLDRMMKRIEERESRRFAK